MPYICLIQDLPDGALQITDLWPNSSSKNNSIDPPGQTRYVNRVKNDPIHVGPNGKLIKAAEGLGAYISSRITFPKMKIFFKLNQPEIGNHIKLWGLKFEAADVQNPAVGDFTFTGNDEADAANLLTVLNARKALLEERTGLPLVFEVAQFEDHLGLISWGVMITATESGPPIMPDPGKDTEFDRNGGGDGRLDMLNTLTGTPITGGGDGLEDGLTSWDLDGVSIAPIYAQVVVDLLDACAPLTLGDMQNAFAAVRDEDNEPYPQHGYFDVSDGSQPGFKLEEVLSILSGREFTLLRGAPSDAGEFGPYTHTVDGEAFEHSFEHGQLKAFREEQNTIYPNRLPTYHNASPSMKTKGAPRPKKDVALIVVYNDDGTVKTDLG